MPKAVAPCLFMEEKDQFWRLLARHLSGEITDEEQAQLQQMLADDPVLQHAAAIVGTVWQHGPAPEPVDPSERVSALLNRIRKETES